MGELVSSSAAQYSASFQTLETTAAGRLSALRRRVHFAESRVSLSVQLNAALGGEGTVGRGGRGGHSSGGGGGGGGGGAKRGNTSNGGEQSVVAAKAAEALSAQLEAREADLARREAAAFSTGAVVVPTSMMAHQGSAAAAENVAELEAEISRLQDERAMLLRELKAVMPGRICSPRRTILLHKTTRAQNTLDHAVSNIC